MIKINEGKLKEISAAQVRVKRDQLLAECDWTMVNDAPTDKDVWGQYRQALRDVSEQAGFPDSVVWPESPGE